VLVVAKDLGPVPPQPIEDLGSGVPVGVLSTPTWMTAILGGKRLKKSGVEEVLEPWCVTFRIV